MASSRSCRTSHATDGNLLVAMIGNLRGGEQAWLTLERQVLVPLSADLALLAARDDLDAIGRSVLLRRARFVWEVQEYYDWGVMIDELLGSIGWRKNVSLSPGLWGGVRYPKRCKTWCRKPQKEILRGAGAITLALRMVLLRHLDDLAASASKAGGPAYSHVMLTRSDYLYACAHPALRPAPGTLHVPRGEDHMGLNDRHAVFAFASRRAALAVLPWLARGGCRGCIAIENAMRGYYDSLRGTPDELTLCRYQPPMFTVARPGENTSWVYPAENAVPTRDYGPATLFCKYDSEYRHTARTCVAHLQPAQQPWPQSRPSPRTVHPHGPTSSCLRADATCPSRAAWRRTRSSGCGASRASPAAGRRCTAWGASRTRWSLPRCLPSARRRGRGSSGSWRNSGCLRRGRRAARQTGSRRTRHTRCATDARRKSTSGASRRSLRSWGRKASGTRLPSACVGREAS